MPRNTTHIRSVTTQHALLLTAYEVPNAHRGIVGTSDKFAIRTAEADAADGVFVRLIDLDVVHVGLPILDETRIVGGEEPFLVV